MTILNPDNNDQTPPDDAPMLVLPGHFVGPHGMPIHVDVTGVYDHTGTWWIMMRVETVHGSFITFLQPHIAVSVAGDIERAVHAEETTMFVPDPEMN